VSSIEIRPFEGSAAELAAFTNRVWHQTYAGKMLTPVWSPQHFERDLLGDERDRDFLIAAYDGTRLIGSHPAKPLRVRLHGHERPATWASFLSVDPAYRRHGLALRLQDEYVRRHREREVPLNFGFNYIRSVHSLGPEFWRRQGVRLVAKMGVWTRALDHAAVGRFELYRREAWGARMLGLVQRRPRPPRDMQGLRDLRPGCAQDLREAMELMAAAGAGADLAYLWDEASAARQLAYPGLSATVVLEAGGRLRGLVNYTLLDVLGRCPMRTARIDEIAFGGLKQRDRRRLMKAALHRMTADGAQGVVALRGSWRYGRDLARAGFLPVPPEFFYVAMTTRDDLPLDGVRRLQVVWR
jgi:hypothetical protein